MILLLLHTVCLVNRMTSAVRQKQVQSLLLCFCSIYNYIQLCYIMNRKHIKLLNKHQDDVRCQSCNKCSTCTLSALLQGHNRFSTRLLQCRWYVVRSEPRRPLFQVYQIAAVVMETTQLLLQGVSEKKYSPQNVFGIVSLPLCLFAWNFADLLAIHIHVYPPTFVDLS